MVDYLDWLMRNERNQPINKPQNRQTHYESRGLVRKNKRIFNDSANFEH